MKAWSTRKLERLLDDLALALADSGPDRLQVRGIEHGQYAGIADADARRGFEDLSTDADRFEFAGREVYWLIRGKLSESPLFGKDLTKITGGAPMMMRNMSTVCRLVAKYPSAD